ncbi:unnamed protein product [Danaus chrysippus]|uniref:(African queen) hypothetical protein n=1 Tax=Danaus chrysippus TaxID=151541 RepID=A0A8J2QKX0_9NEOP|nr:unnamed protein product [Danaus chrysippus]
MIVPTGSEVYVVGYLCCLLSGGGERIIAAKIIPGEGYRGGTIRSRALAPPDFRPRDPSPPPRGFRQKEKTLWGGTDFTREIFTSCKKNRVGTAVCTAGRELMRLNDRKLTNLHCTQQGAPRSRGGRLKKKKNVTPWLATPTCTRVGSFRGRKSKRFPRFSNKTQNALGYRCY